MRRRCVSGLASPDLLAGEPVVAALASVALRIAVETNPFAAAAEVPLAEMSAD
jgi:hypothetical protein